MEIDSWRQTGNTDRQRQIETQIDEQIDRQIDRQIDGEIERKKLIETDGLR